MYDECTSKGWQAYLILYSRIQINVVLEISLPLDTSFLWAATQMLTSKELRDRPPPRRYICHSPQNDYLF